jgi:hypothetical protein
MTSSTILDLTQQALVLVLLLSLPIVLTAAVVGLAVAILQAVTQVQDSRGGAARIRRAARCGLCRRLAARAAGARGAVV